MLRQTRLSRLTWRAGVKGVVKPRQARKLTLDGLVRSARRALAKALARFPIRYHVRTAMTDAQEERLIQALTKVDVHGDVARTHAQDPMTAVLRQRAVQPDLMRWGDSMWISPEI